MGQFSERAQPLVRGDIGRLEHDYQKLVDKFTAEGKALEESKECATEAYATMCETRLRMPAMEVVVAGAQYYVGRRPPTYHQSTPYAEPSHVKCLEFLHGIGVAVDAQDVAGFTAFMRAAQTSQSRSDLAQALLEMGADVNHRSRFGGVVLHEAMMAQDRKAVAFLTRNGASMDIQDNDGVSPRDIVSLIL
ncbi:hypothetical protein EC988_000980 [Linderina pennispora]|nr:hypothetical protein EC988_000980 [Linderina pennispora]